MTCKHYPVTFEHPNISTHCTVVIFSGTKSLSINVNMPSHIDLYNTCSVTGGRENCIAVDMITALHSSVVNATMEFCSWSVLPVQCVSSHYQEPGYMPTPGMSS